MSEKTERNYHVVPNIRKLYLNTDTADATFIFELEGRSERVPAHKCLLAIASPVFRQMFFGQLKEGAEIRIVDASAAGFIEFLQFFYLENVTFTGDNIAEVMRLADKYDVAGCMNLCARYLEVRLSADTACSHYELALLFDLTYLIGVCEEKICLESRAVLKSSAFLHCSRLALERILSLDELSCDEIHVFQACMLWATESCRRADIDESVIENLKQELGTCFDRIRFPAMSAEDFYACIADKENLFTSAEIMDILSHLTLHRPLQVAVRFTPNARRGHPTWTKDDSICICDRRSVPNLVLVKPLRRDVVLFSVNERILLGQISIGTFKPKECGAGIEYRFGILSVRKRLENSINDADIERTVSDVDVLNKSELLLSQSIQISSATSNRIQLSKPLVLQPFQNYAIESEWELNDDDALAFHAECRAEIMLDGGVRFQFKGQLNLLYDNVVNGLVSRFYFKRW